MKRLAVTTITAVAFLMTFVGCKYKGDILPVAVLMEYVPHSVGQPVVYCAGSDTIELEVTYINSMEVNNMPRGCDCSVFSMAKVTMKDVLNSDVGTEIEYTIRNSDNGTVHFSYMMTIGGEYVRGLFSTANYELPDEVILQTSKHQEQEDYQSGIIRKGAGLVQFTDPMNRIWMLVEE